MMRGETFSIRPTPREILLAASLLLLTGIVWLEPAGSHLAEPDETRYAQIPREMLASGDFVTPRLNGVPYLEKPPLLYWANAAAFHVFGENPWAARLPARLASLGTVFLLLIAAGSLWGREAGLAAGLFYLLSPLGFALSRLNVTDGMLTFFFTATLLAARATIRRHEAGRPTALLSAVTGLAAAGAVLSKGAVGLVLPGAIILVWGLTRSARSLRPLFLGPAGAIFLLAAAPWFVVMERRHPGFLDFFFVREHLLRFTSTVHEREGPVFYFLLVFASGFVVGLPFLAASLVRSRRMVRERRESDDLFFLIWLVVVLAFFTLSRSKLAPYILPAFPPAAILAARAFATAGRRSLRPFLANAVLGSLLIAGAAITPVVRSWVAEYHFLPFALISAFALAIGAWTAVVLAARRAPGALPALAAGWMVLYACLALAWPRTPSSTDVQALGSAARAVADRTAARVVFYRTFLYGVLWELDAPLAVAGYRGELQPDVRTMASADPKVFWGGPKFWSEWASSRPVLAIVRARNLPEFKTHGGAARILARGRGHFLVSNFRFGPLPTTGLRNSVALYTPEAGATPLSLHQVPPRVLERARRESGGERIVWAIMERENGVTAFELMTAGPRPRALEVSPEGDLVYVEEEVDPGRLPGGVIAALSRVYPGMPVAFATRESRRRIGPPVIYEVYLRRGTRVREVSFESNGRVFSAEGPAF